MVVSIHLRIVKLEERLTGIWEALKSLIHQISAGRAYYFIRGKKKKQDKPVLNTHTVLPAVHKDSKSSTT